MRAGSLPRRAKALTGALEEGQLLVSMVACLASLLLAPGARRRGGRRRQVEPQRQPGSTQPSGVRWAQSARGDQLVAWDAPAPPLVGKAGVGEAVAQHGLALRQGRLDAVDDVVAPAGKHQQHLGHRVHGLAQHQAAQGLGQRRATGSRVSSTVAPRCSKPRSHGRDVGGFAGTVDAFEAMNLELMQGAFQRPRWNLLTARLCAQVVTELTAAITARHEVQGLGAGRVQGCLPQRGHTRHGDRRGGKPPGGRRCCRACRQVALAQIAIKRPPRP